MRVQRIALTVCLVFATAIWAGVMSCELDVDEQGREIKSIEDSWSSSASPGMGVPAVDTAFAVEELEKNPLWTFETDSALAYLGRDISICNLNGDGYDDLVATAPHYDNGIYRQGRTYIFYGTASGFPESPDDTLESGVNDGNMGAVSCAGNVNGDAYDDLLVTVPGYSEDETDEGIAFLFLGSASGIGESQAWEYQSNQSDIYMGTAVTWCNVNGDGYDDVVIGTPNYDNIQGTEGQVLVFYSNGSLPSSTPDWDYESDQAGASLGRDVACAGDINGDFYDDLIVSAPNWDIEVATASISVGKVYAFYGSNGGLAAGPNWSAVGSFHQGSFGSGLAAAGDVNNDGYDDIIVGAYNVSNPENAEGRAHVFLGSSSAPSTSPDSTMEQNVASAYFGIGVSRFGDFNDDGYDDIIVTGRYNVPDATAYGGIAVFFYPGGPSGLGATPDPEWWVSIPGGENTYAALTMIDDYDGDGYPEFVFGQRAWSNGQGSEGRIGIISPYPLNDQCGQAEALGTLPASVVGKNGGAADEYTPTCGGSSGGRDVIYSFEGIFNHNYYVDLTGDFNTIVAVHYGACEGTLIGCNDDFGSLSHSRVEFTAPATDTYFVWVDGWAGSAYGEYTLTVGEIGTTTTTSTTTTTTPPTTTTTTVPGTTTTTSPGTTTTTTPGTTTTTLPGTTTTTAPGTTTTSSTTTTAPGTTTTTSPGTTTTTLPGTTTTVPGTTTTTAPGTTTTVPATTSTTTTTAATDDDTSDDDVDDDDTGDDDTGGADDDDSVPLPDDDADDDLDDDATRGGDDDDGGRCCG